MEAMLYMCSTNPNENRFRWYAMSLHRCLFGGIDLVCRWGRLGQSGGSEKYIHFDDEHHALKRARERRRL